ncbi:MAG: hypothetical protein ACR2N3_05905 [Pyrinomonadaceae bacterium]
MIGSKKNLPFSVRVRRELVEPDNKQISVVRQCQLLGLNRTGLYYCGRPQSVEDGELMRLIDAQYTITPFYGYRRMRVYLQNLGFVVQSQKSFTIDEKTRAGGNLPEA